MYLDLSEYNTDLELRVKFCIKKEIGMCQIKLVKIVFNLSLKNPRVRVFLRLRTRHFLFVISC